VVEIRQTEVHARWFARLRDRQARFRILARVRRLSLGNPGDKSTQQRDIERAKALADGLE
jgi:putative component of toxin-antitoxin plasmid stabilization module